MAEITVKIPQIGEGLQEARVVAFLREPGDWVKRDDAIYQMETDKAVMDVESPVEGRIVRWLAKADDVLAIGADILIVETQAEAPAAPVESVSPTVQPLGEETPQPLGTVELAVPQIGEGLQEARIVAFLKQPGDTVKRDEPVYQMETDKAVMDVESPYDGTLVKWVAEVDQVLSIGAPVGVMATSAVPSGAEASTVTDAKPVAPPVVAPKTNASRRTDVPPRTRAYAREKGLTNEQIEAVHAKGSKLMPEDIDAFLAGPTKAPTGSRPYSERAMGGKQRILSSRLSRGNQIVVPGMMSVCVPWSGIDRERDWHKATGGEFQPSAFTYFAFAVAKAAAKHPIVRSTLVGDGTIRTYEHVHLGIAVARPDDELVVAVVDNADTLTWEQFAAAAREAIQHAREGEDQAHEAVTLSITNMSGHGIRDAMAVVVPPGVVTVFVGEVHWAFPGDMPIPQRCANVGVTIDHRLINGVPGAEFLKDVKHHVETISEVVRG